MQRGDVRVGDAAGLGDGAEMGQEERDLIGSPPEVEAMPAVADKSGCCCDFESVPLESLALFMEGGLVSEVDQRTFARNICGDLEADAHRNDFFDFLNLDFSAWLLEGHLFLVFEGATEFGQLRDGFLDNE